MEPTTGPGLRPAKRTICVLCDGPLAETDPDTCRPCVAASYTACREIKGRAILAADILAVRRRQQS